MKRKHADKLTSGELLAAGFIEEAEEFKKRGEKSNMMRKDGVLIVNYRKRIPKENRYYPTPTKLKIYEQSFQQNT